MLNLVPAKFSVDWRTSREELAAFSTLNLGKAKFSMDSNLCAQDSTISSTLNLGKAKFSVDLNTQVILAYKLKPFKDLF